MFYNFNAVGSLKICLRYYGIKKHLLAKHLEKNELQAAVLRSRFELILIKTHSFVTNDTKNNPSRVIADHLCNKN